MSAKTLRGIIEDVSSVTTMEMVATRNSASMLYAPRRKSITPKRLYQVTVNDVATTGTGGSTEAWKTKADAELSAQRKRDLLTATWGNDAPVVKVQSTTELVDTVKEWANIDISLYRQYQRSENGYTYIGVSQ